MQKPCAGRLTVHLAEERSPEMLFGALCSQRNPAEGVVMKPVLEIGNLVSAITRRADNGHYSGQFSAFAKNDKLYGVLPVKIGKRGQQRPAFEK